MHYRSRCLRPLFPVSGTNFAKVFYAVARDKTSTGNVQGTIRVPFWPLGLMKEMEAVAAGFAEPDDQCCTQLHETLNHET
eukprot:3896697-Rhodomonas_salina.1